MTIETNSNNQFETITNNGVEFLNVGNKLKAYYDANPQAEVYLVKKEETKGRIAKAGEIVKCIEDGQEAVQTAEEGDIILQNKSDQGEYIYRHGKGTVEQRVNKFNEAYEAHPNKDDLYVDKGCRPAKLATENISGLSSWGLTTETKAGGYIIRDGDGAYTIAAESIQDYRFATKEEIIARVPGAKIEEVTEGVYGTIIENLENYKDEEGWYHDYYHGLE